MRDNPEYDYSNLPNTWAVKLDYNHPQRRVVIDCLNLIHGVKYAGSNDNYYGVRKSYDGSYGGSSIVPFNRGRYDTMNFGVVILTIDKFVELISGKPKPLKRSSFAQAMERFDKK